MLTKDDFKPEERDGVVARMVLDGGLAICKLCGAGESELDEPCPYHPDYRRQAKVLISRGDDFQEGEIGVVLKNTYPEKYDYLLALPSKTKIPYKRLFYFFEHEIQLMEKENGN